MLVTAGVGLAGIVVLIGVLTLLWHVFYVLKGRPKLDLYQQYSEHLFNRGLVTFAALGCFVFVVAIVGVIGRNVTARNSHATVVRTIDSVFTGTFTRVLRDSLPKSSRRYLGKHDVIIVQGVGKLGRERDRVVFRANGNLAESIRDAAVPVSVLKTTWVKRYPADVFRWAGPVYEVEHVVAVGTDTVTVVGGLEFWTSMQ